MIQMNRATTAAPSNFALQSTPKHVAIIMDGNRRWARAQNLPPAEGHRQGVETLVTLLPAFTDSSVEVLTLFAFSSANWRRQDTEVTNLMRLADQALRRLTPMCCEKGISVEVIGRDDRVPHTLRRRLQQTQQATAQGTRQLRIALDYSSRDQILAAARRVGKDCDMHTFTQALCPAGDVDLLIRTGKEQRLSDFLLWECAFAELYFPDVYWPDFTVENLRAAIAWYRQRNRRYGV